MMNGRKPRTGGPLSKTQDRTTRGSNLTSDLTGSKKELGNRRSRLNFSDPDPPKGGSRAGEPRTRRSNPVTSTEHSTPRSRRLRTKHRHLRRRQRDLRVRRGNLSQGHIWPEPKTGHLRQGWRSYEPERDRLESRTGHPRQRQYNLGTGSNNPSRKHDRPSLRTSKLRQRQHNPSTGNDNLSRKHDRSNLRTSRLRQKPRNFRPEGPWSKPRTNHLRLGQSGPNTRDNNLSQGNPWHNQGSDNIRPGQGELSVIGPNAGPGTSNRSPGDILSIAGTFIRILVLIKTLSLARLLKTQGRIANSSRSTALRARGLTPIGRPGRKCGRLSGRQRRDSNGLCQEGCEGNLGVQRGVRIIFYIAVAGIGGLRRDLKASQLISGIAGVMANAELQDLLYEPAPRFSWAAGRLAIRWYPMETQWQTAQSRAQCPPGPIEARLRASRRPGHIDIQKEGVTTKAPSGNTEPLAKRAPTLQSGTQGVGLLQGQRCILVMNIKACVGDRQVRVAGTDNKPNQVAKGYHRLNYRSQLDAGNRGPGDSTRLVHKDQGAVLKRGTKPAPNVVSGSGIEQPGTLLDPEKLGDAPTRVQPNSLTGVLILSLLGGQIINWSKRVIYAQQASLLLKRIVRDGSLKLGNICRRRVGPSSTPWLVALGTSKEFRAGGSIPLDKKLHCSNQGAGDKLDLRILGRYCCDIGERSNGTEITHLPSGAIEVNENTVSRPSFPGQSSSEVLRNGLVTTAVGSHEEHNKLEMSSSGVLAYMDLAASYSVRKPMLSIEAQNQQYAVGLRLWKYPKEPVLIPAKAVWYGTSQPGGYRHITQPATVIGLSGGNSLIKVRVSLATKIVQHKVGRPKKWQRERGPISSAQIIEIAIPAGGGLTSRRCNRYHGFPWGSSSTAGPRGGSGAGRTNLLLVSNGNLVLLHVSVARSSLSGFPNIGHGWLNTWQNNIININLELVIIITIVINRNTANRNYSARTVGNAAQGGRDAVDALQAARIVHSSRARNTKTPRTNIQLVGGTRNDLPKKVVGGLNHHAFTIQKWRETQH